MTFKECMEMNVDYLSLSEGIIYCIQEYNKYIKEHGHPPTDGLKVVDCIDQSLINGYLSNNSIDIVLGVERKWN